MCEELRFPFEMPHSSNREPGWLGRQARPRVPLEGNYSKTRPPDDHTNDVAIMAFIHMHHMPDGIHMI